MLIEKAAGAEHHTPHIVPGCPTLIANRLLWSVLTVPRGLDDS